MKATLNLATREVKLEYTIKEKDLKYEEDYFEDFELQYLDNGKILCKHSIFFKDLDEWQSSLLFDGRMIDFHYDYQERKDFSTKKEWLGYIFQGYEYTEGEEQRYEKDVIKKIQLKL
jgi:hypothetical protein